MDGWTNTYPDVDPPESQPTLLDQDRRAIEDRHVRARHAETTRVAELEQTQALDAGGSPAEADVPLPFATPPGVSLAF
ncbi:hypothetical protein [Raineyella sp.]|uniref:hypothetical protein n=1 Tax=Raineyella sp. TaxID=1911550 RepID=UPI002B20C099|nr:hypothetical protein [Raineyella sp.]MEA5154338.1 hypothetical protein [Raineyella sp.]